MAEALINCRNLGGHHLYNNVRAGQIQINSKAVLQISQAISGGRYKRTHLGFLYVQDPVLVGLYAGARVALRRIGVTFPFCRMVIAWYRVGSEHGEAVCAGRVSGGADLPVRDDIHCLGELDYATIPLHLSALDVEVIMNSNKRFARYCFPQKFFEMLARRLPVALKSGGDAVDVLADCPGAISTPGGEGTVKKAIIYKLEHHGRPDAGIPQWELQGERLSIPLDELVPGGDPWSA